MGILTVFVTAVLIWHGSKYALSAALATFVAHTLVMVVLQSAYRDVVATDSIVAMTVRMVVWLVILGLLLAQRRKDKRLTSA